MDAILAVPPKSIQAANLIRAEILSQALKPGDRLQSTRQFAQSLAVSNRVIQSAFEILEREGVIETRVGCGTFVASPGKSIMSKTVALMLEGSEDPHARLPLVLPASLQAKGFMPYLFDVSLSYEKSVISSVMSLLESRPSAFVVDATSKFNATLLDGLRPGTRLFFVKRCELPRRPDASYILEDYVGAGRNACAHILSKGRRKIAILSFERRPGWTSDLLAQGVEAELKERGFEPPAFIDCVSKGRLDLRFDNGFPDGFICSYDFLYAKARRELESHGLILGRDYDVVGYGRTPWSEAFGIPSLEQVAPRIAAKLLEAMASESQNDASLTPEILEGHTEWAAS